LLSIEGLGRLCPAGPIQFFAPSTKSNKGAVLQRLFLSTEGVPADDSRADRRTLLWRPRNIRTKKNWPSLFLPVLGRLMKANAGKRSTQLYRRRTRGPSGPTTSELISIGPFFVPSEKSPRRSNRRSTRRAHRLNSKLTAAMELGFTANGDEVRGITENSS
jgi:hypothetical protein